MGDVQDWHATDQLHAEQGQGDPFAAAVRATRMAMIITDPRQADNPIVFANASFLDLTGYAREEVLGRNCRFLQGPDTAAHTVAAIRNAVDHVHDIAVDILNYRKDGTPFWNGLYLSPVTSSTGELQFFFASQLDVSDRINAQRHVNDQKEILESEVRRRTKDLEEALAAKTMLVHEVDHRVKNNLQMISTLLAMQVRTIKDADARQSLADMLQRIEAIGTVHRRLYQSADVQVFDLGDFVRDVASELVKASGRADVKLTVELEEVRVSSQHASPIALMMNELITNALKHAFPDGRAGRLSIKVASQADRMMLMVIDDGVGLPPGSTAETGFGRRLIRVVARQLQADLHWRAGHPGTIVEVSLPMPRLQEASA